MQGLRDNFFCRSHPRFGSAGGLEHERQLLVLEQKFCKARARKFSLETNRRRKALEERRRQWDVQEQRLRDDVLQQRRRRVQDATERFQRAHLPPSERRRQPFRRNVPSLEDALCQLRGGGGGGSGGASCTRPSSVLSVSSNVSRSCTPSPKPPAASKPWLRQALSAVEAYTKLLQEQSFRSGRETGDSRRDHGPQDAGASDRCGSDSPSSQDSLEVEDADDPRRSSSPDGEESGLILRKRSDLFPTSDPTPPPRLKLHERTDQGDRDKTRLSKASRGFTSEAGPALHDLFTFCKIIGADSERSEENSPPNSADGTTRPKPEAPLDEWPKPETPLAKNGSGGLLASAPKSNIFLSDSVTDNASQEAGRETRSHKDPSASINDLNKAPSSERKPADSAPPRRACPSNIQDAPASRSACEVRIVKGILKKPSGRRASGDAACYGAGRLVFAKQVALAIRDSVELTRAKARDVGGGGVKKKLRWFDEVHVKDKDQDESSDPSHAGPGLTPATPAGDRFTKQAWADVGVQVGLPQERADDVAVPRGGGARAGGPRVPRRAERSARAGAAPVSSRSRKGAVIRPQSAAEVSRIAGTAGRTMVPRPPPRTEAAKEKMACAAKAPYGAERVPLGDASEGPAPLHTHPVIRTDISVTYAPPPPPPPPSFTCPASDGSRRGGAALCLDRTPTDEDISQLWRGVRSALASEEVKSMLGGAGRKPGTDPGSGSGSGSGSGRPPQPTKPSKDPVRTFSGAGHVIVTDEGSRSAARIHLATEPDAAISLEEQRVLLSLDRLDRRLHCVREHAGSGTGGRSLGVVDASAKKETKVTNHHGGFLRKL